MTTLLDAKIVDAPDETLVSSLRERLAALPDDAELPDEARFVRELLALDDEVRNGGFAQYFFNPSCVGAIDAWFAAAAVDPRIHEILSSVLLRLGELARVDLDLAAMVKRRGPGSLMPAALAIVDVQRKAQSAEPDPLTAFQQFAKRCAFNDLDDAYFDTNLNASVVAFVRKFADVFTAPID